MIKVKRHPKPVILIRNDQKWLDELRKSSGKARKAKQNRYQHKEIKETLVEMFDGKCAYCESKITHVDYGHIEHYRPKSLREDLTFDWTNLLLACGICNGANHKGNRFPEHSEDGPIVNPCEDEPTKHLRFEYDRSANLANVYGKSRRGKTTEKLLGLNRPELRAYRSKVVKRLIVVADFAITQKDPAAIQLMNEAIGADAEYAAFARALIDGKLLKRS